MAGRFPLCRFLVSIFLAVFLLSGMNSACGSNKDSKKEKNNSSKVANKGRAKPKAKKLKVGYEKIGLVKTRGDIHLYKPEELEAIALEVGPDQGALVFVGDILLWDRTKKFIKKHGWGYPFMGTRPLLTKADLLVGNLEGPLAKEANKRSTKGFFYKAPLKSVEGLKEGGFDVVTLGNNHLLDCSEPGLKETIDILEKEKIGWFGAGSSDKEARAPYIATVKGVKIAMIGGISPEIYFSTSKDINKPERVKSRIALCERDLTMINNANTMGAFIYNPQTLTEDVVKAKKTADVVIVNLHMGVRYWRPPYKAQVALAKAAAEGGADLVIGHHAHFWQPVEMIGHTAVIYGIGNFAFGSGNKSADEGLLVRAILSTKEKRISKIELFPTYIKNRDKRVQYQTKVLKGAAAKAVLEDIRAWSLKVCDTDLKIVRDRIVIEIPQ